MQTTPLTLPSRAAAVATVLRAAWARHRDGLSFLLLIVAVLAGVLLSRLGATWPAAAAADPVIVIASPTAPLALLPTAAKVAAVPTLAHDVAAFAAPAGAYLGTAPAGAAYAVESRNPEGWAILRVAGVGGYDGQGRIWVAPSDAPPEAAQVPVLTTPIPAPPGVAAPAPAPESPPPAAEPAPQPAHPAYAAQSAEPDPVRVVVVDYTRGGFLEGSASNLPDRPIAVTNDQGRVILGGHPNP